VLFLSSFGGDRGGNQKYKKMKIGIYSGSFNPIHLGHTALADYIIEHSDLDEIWLVVSPHNPLKNEAGLLDDKTRLEMAKLAVAGFPRIKVSDVEFFLPKPSYTIQTLNYLSGKFPENEYTLIIGADNLEVFDKWRDYKKILSAYRVFVYPREGFGRGIPKEYSPAIFIDAPLFNISSTEIRKKIKQGEDVEDFLNAKVWKFIRVHKLYV
jgi:nicotinate-nucleotide adenylyltransferase